MRNSFSNPDFTTGVRDPTTPVEDTEDRSWGTFAKDVAIDVSRPVVSLARTAAQGARALDVPGAKTAETFLGDVEQDMTGARSPRARALDTLSVDPGPNERSFWREMGAGAVHMALPTVPFAVAALLTGGTSIPAQVGAAGLAGVQGAGEGVNQLADFARRTPREELMQLEPFQNFMRDNGGNEEDAREKLFRSSLDWKASAASFAANAAEFGVFLHGLGIKGTTTPIKQRFINALKGAGEGTVAGAAEGATDVYTEQVGKVRTGVQENIDPQAIASGAASGAIFGAPAAAMHAAGPTVRPTRALDTDTRGVLDQQINPPTPPPAAGPAPGPAPEPDQPAGPGGGGTATPPQQFPPAPEFPPPRQAPDVNDPTVQPTERWDSSDFAAAPTQAPDQATGQQPGVSPPQAAPSVPDGALDDSFTGTFKTAKGSEYYTYPDGTTVRNKAPRPEHPGEQGIQPRSGMTIFLTPGHSHVLRAMMGRPTRYAKQLGFTKAGRLGMRFTEGPSAGKFMEGSLGRVSQSPVVGMDPLEIWEGGRFHFGNSITEVSERSASAEGAAPPAPADAPADVGAGSATPGVTPVPVPDVRRAEPVPVELDPETASTLKAIMMGVKSTERQNFAGALSDRLGRMGRITGADIPPDMSKGMSPEDAAVLRTALETDPVTAIEIVRETKSDEIPATYEAYKARYPDRLPAEEPVVDRPNRPKPPTLKPREDFYAMRGPNEPVPITRAMGTEGEAGFQAQEAAERARNKAAQPAFIEPGERQRAAKQREAERFARKSRREQKLIQRAAQRRAKGEAIVRSDADRARMFANIDQLAQRYERKGQPVPERPQPEYEAGPLPEESQLLKDIDRFNINVKAKSVEIGPAQRATLVKRAQAADRARAARGGDQPFAAAILKLPKAETSAGRFNRTLEKINNLADKPRQEVAQSREAFEVYQQLLVINTERVKARGHRLPIPRWLHDAMVQRDVNVDNAMAKAIEDQKERQAAYEAARQKLLAEKRATVKPRMRPVNIDRYTVETAKFRDRFENRPAIEREAARNVATRQAAPLIQTPRAEQVVIEEAERRMREAQDRVAEGGPLRLPGADVPTRTEALERLRKLRRKNIVDARGKVTREGQYSSRENAIDISLREAVNARFGSPAKFIEFVRSVYQNIAAEQPKRPGRESLESVQAGDVVAVTRPRDGETIRALRPSTTANKYNEDLENYYKKKLELLGQSRRLKKFLDFALKKVKQDLKTRMAEEGIRGEGSITWGLPEGKYNKNTNRYSFNIGKSEDEFAMYGIANDLQKLDEALRFQAMGLENLAPASRNRVPRPGELFSRAGQPSSFATELDRYLRPQKVLLDNFAKDILYWINPRMKDNRPDYSPITSERKARSNMTTQKYLEGEIELTPQGEEVSVEDRSAAIADPDVRGEDQIIAELDKELAHERRLAERAGRNIMSEEDRFARLAQIDPVLHAKLERSRKLKADNFDADGFPANRWDQEFQTEFTPDEQAKLDAYAELDMAGKPTSPLVEQSSVPSVLNEVKQIVTSGVMTDVPTEYINDDFLDQLGRVAGRAEVYTTPVDVVSAGSMDAPAHYNAKLDRVVLPSDASPAAFARAAMHEITHAATNRLMLSDARFAGDVRSILNRAVAAAKARGIDTDRLPKHLYGLMSPDEFIAETVANRRFRQFLESVRTPTHPVIQGVRNAMNAVYRAIRDAWRRVVGAKNGDTALDVLYYDQSTVLGRADTLVRRALRTQRDGRPAYRESVNDDPKLYNDGKYYLRMAGVKAFLDDLPTNLNNQLQQTKEHLNYTLQNTQENQGKGLSWHTLADMTHRGSHEFRAISSKLFAAIEQQFATRANITRYEDTPKLAKIAEFLNKLDSGTRQRVQEFLIDESYHGFYADQHLSHVSNKHFSDNLANYQSKSLHASMMKEFQTLNQIPGFAEARKLMLDTGVQKEETIRKDRIRNLLHHSGLIPESMRDGAERERLVDALEAFVDHYQKPSQAQLALLRQHLGSTDNPQLQKTVADINEVEDISRISGPYQPFVRKGDYAVSGNFKLPVPPGATMLDPPVNAATGKPQGEPRIVFNTQAEAEKYVDKITRDFALTQTGGGSIDIDVATGQRPKIEKETDIGTKRMVTARGDDLKKFIADGGNVQKKYYVQFQTQLLEFHPTKYDADRSVKQWRDMYGDRVQVAGTQEVYKHDGRQNEQYVSAQLQKMVRRIRAQPTYQALSEQEKAALEDSMNLAAAQFVNRRGIKQRFLPRGYVKGASTDIANNWKDYLSMTAGYSAKLKHNADISQYSKEMKDYLDSHQFEQGNNNLLVHQRVYNAYMRRLHSPTVNNRDTTLNRWVDRALRYTMLDKLPSMAYFTINATEPSVVALPLIAGRHAYRAAATTMGQFYRMAMKSTRADDPAGGSFKLPNFFTAGVQDLKLAFKNDNTAQRANWLQIMSGRVAGEADAAGLQDMLRQASERGVFDASSSLEYDRAFVNSPALVDRIADRLQNIFMAANTAVENLNRFVTTSTAYRMERSRLNKMNESSPDIRLTDQELHQQAVDYAISIAHQAAGQYANYNAPERFNTGPFARVMFQFKKYPQRIVANYIRATVNAFGKDPVLRKQGLRQLGFMLGTQMMVAGAMGLPLEPFTIPLNTLHIMGIVPYNADDVQAGWRQWFAQNWSPEVGELLAHGPLRMTGIDISSRLSQASLLTFGSPASTRPKDLQASAFTMMAGAAGSTGFEVVTGMQKLNEGLKAWRNGADDVAFKKFNEASQHLILFRAAADVLSAINQGDAEGNRTSSGRQMREPLSFGQQVIRATGFQPAPSAEAAEARRAVKQATERVKSARKTLIDQWVQSPPGAQRSAIFEGAIRDFNAGKPDGVRITRADLMRAQGTYQKARTQGTDKLGLAVDKQMRTLLPDAGAYMTR